LTLVLHDIFDIPFDTIAAILGRSPAATKMLASLARSRLRLGAPAADTHAPVRDVVDAFLAAAARGESTCC
jgi:RNA polymerase sigma-70 factor (ECF subfamily)